MGIAAGRAAAAAVAAVALRSRGAGASEGSGSASCGGEPLGEWLYDISRWSPPGYHVLCVDQEVEDEYVNGEAIAAGDRWRVRLWTGGHGEREPQAWHWQRTAGADALPQLRADVQRRAAMRVQSRWRILPWALYTAGGQLVGQERHARGVLLAFEGGRWVWPGIREGFERRVPLDGFGAVTLRTLTLDPLAFTMENFIPRHEAEAVVVAAKPRFKRAEIAKTDSGAGGEQARTCSEAWVAPEENADLGSIADRAAALQRVPRRLQALQFRVMEYKKGQQFMAHTDFYDKKDFKKDPKMTEELKHGRNWLVTIYIYLSTVKAGGETYFPSTYGKALPMALDVCEGPSVAPRLGRALMFYSLHPDGKPNLSSMHGGCKVKSGIKHTVNLWTFNQALDPAQAADLEAAQSREEVVSRASSDEF